MNRNSRIVEQAYLRPPEIASRIETYLGHEMHFDHRVHWDSSETHPIHLTKIVSGVGDDACLRYLIHLRGPRKNNFPDTTLSIGFKLQVTCVDDNPTLRIFDVTGNAGWFRTNVISLDDRLPSEITLPNRRCECKARQFPLAWTAFWQTTFRRMARCLAWQLWARMSAVGTSETCGNGYGRSAG